MMQISAEQTRQAGAAQMFVGRLLCLAGLVSITYAAYGMFMGYPQSTTFFFGLLSALYLLGERYRRTALAHLSEAIAQEFKFRDSATQPEELGNVQPSWKRTLIVRYGMQTGVLLVSLGAITLVPVLLAVGKEVRTGERTADWTDLLSLSASLVMVVAALVGESRAYAMVITPRFQDRPDSFRPVAMVMWGVLSLFPLAYVGARATTTGGGPAAGPDIFPVYAVAAFLGAACVARGNRVFRLYVRAKTSRVVKSPDEVRPRTFSLLLRPFDEDTRLMRDQQVFTAKSLLKGLFSVGEPEEQKICRALEWAGAPLAVGVPDEDLAPDGAARFYLPAHPPQQWQATVTKMMVRARLVVLILGDKDGVAWELAEACRVVPPQRLVLVVPVRAAGYTALQRNLREAMRPHLKPTDQVPDFPEYGGGFGLSSRIQGIIYFTSGWQPVYAPLRAGLSPTDRLVLSLMQASVPVAAQLRRYESGTESDDMGKQH